MSEHFDVAAGALLGLAVFLVGFATLGGEAALLVLVGAFSACYVGIRVGTLRQRVDELEARLDESD